ncbi:fam63a protein [Nymphaea thermarum]|nr:fam63a protein [Nymphaea thermarum]
MYGFMCISGEDIGFLNRNDGYVKNQLQSISDAIDLVPSLATGINVNVRFRNINDFESAPVCAILDLLDIGLVHGWVVDPQASVSLPKKAYDNSMENGLDEEVSFVIRITLVFSLSQLISQISMSSAAARSFLEGFPHSLKRFAGKKKTGRGNERTVSATTHALSCGVFVPCILYQLHVLYHHQSRETPQCPASCGVLIVKKCSPIVDMQLKLV